MAAQGRETGMHLRRQRAPHGAGARVGGPVPGIRVTAGELFGNGEAFGHHDPALARLIGQAKRGNGARRGKTGEDTREIIAVEFGQRDPGVQAEGLEQKPAAQRPAGIGAIADAKVIVHPALRFRPSYGSPCAATNQQLCGDSFEKLNLG